jgi:hypothetical protein
MSDDDETEGSAVRRRGSDEPASAQLASAPSTAGSPPATRRKRKKKPAGSKWLNRLLAIGCCASLIPLGLEFWWSLRPDHMGKPKKDDPWVRVIDAAPPEEALRARRSERALKQFRHHPRHARVRADGTMSDLDEEERFVPQNVTELSVSAVTLAAAAAAAAMADTLPSTTLSSATAAAAAAAASATEQQQQQQQQQQQAAQLMTDVMPGAAANASSPRTATTGVAHALRQRLEQRGVTGLDVEDDLITYFREADRRIDAALANRTLGANRTSERRGVGGMHRIWRTVPGGVHDVIEGEGDERVVYSVDALLAPTTANGSYVVDPTDALDPLTLTYLNRNLTWVDRLTPFRVVVAVVERMPKSEVARRAYEPDCMLTAC